MRTSMISYQTSNESLTNTAHQVRASWSDSVGDKFYSEIIEPMHMEAMAMREEMHVLVCELERIKSEIDAI